AVPIVSMLPLLRTRGGRGVRARPVSSAFQRPGAILSQRGLKDRARRVSDGISARHRAQRATDITGERPRARPAADEASLPGGVTSRTTVNGPAHAWEAPSAYAEGPGARRAPGPGDDGETGSARRRLLLELEPGCIRNALLHPGP